MKRCLMVLGASITAVLAVAAATATTSASAAPAVPTTWKSVSTGGYTSCGIASNSKLYCWGYNGDSQLGQGGQTDEEPHPTPVQVGTSTWLSVRVSSRNVCGIKPDHSAWCWGSNANGVNGNGASGNGVTASPTKVAGSIAWSSIVPGYEDTCGISTTHKLYCWGTDASGGVGDGVEDTTTYLPTRVGSAANWSSVTVGGSSACAIKATKEGYCWGDGLYGQIGNGTNRDAFSPTKLPNTWSNLNATSETVCGVTGGGTARCWGDNTTGQVGDGTTTRRNSPTTLREQQSTFSRMYAGRYVTCGLRRADNGVRCFGYNGYAQFGNGGYEDSVSPVPGLGGAGGWSPISVGTISACGLRPTGALYCWGDNQYGEAGVTNGGDDVLSPTRVGSIVPATKQRGAAPGPPAHRGIS